MKKAHDELPEDNAAVWTELEKRAARIEALEAALRRIADPGGGYTTGDGHARCQEIARAALDAALPTAQDVRGILPLTTDTIDPANPMPDDPPIQQQPNDAVFPGFRGNNEA